jgi:acetyl-CoA acyltransferase
MREAVIVSAVRTPIGKAKRGSLVKFRPDDMAAIVIKEVVNRTNSAVKPENIDDVIIGNAFPEAEQGLNMARIAVFRAGFPDSVPAVTVNRFCSSGLQSIADGCFKVMSGQYDIVIAGGSENMSMVPMTGNKLTPNPYLADNMPQAYINMGLTAENVAEKFNISREEQDEYAYQSNMKAVDAIKSGRFKDEIVPVEIESIVLENGKKVVKKKVFDTDEGPRANTTIEGLAKLKPVFRTGGSVTAGNSSQMSDGAAAVLIMSREKADELGLKPLAKFVAYSVAGCPPELMGIGPSVAIPKVLKAADMKLEDIELFEINEAFASQFLYCCKNLDIDLNKVNVNGGAIALGHPLGCTGSKLTVQLIYEMRRRSLKYGIVSMCIGGGMGAAGIFEMIYE